MYVKEIGADGRARRREVTKTFRLKKAAAAWLATQAAARAEGSWTEPTKLTLGQWLHEWERGALALGAQRARTKAHYARLLATYVKPAAIAQMRLSAITRADVQRLAASLLAQPKKKGGRVPPPKAGAPAETLSPTTVRRTLAALSVAMGAAVEARHIATNPAARIAVGRTERKAVKWLDREQVNALVTGTADDAHGALWLLLAYTGLRPGEALGLGWEHLDLERGTLRVERSLTQVKKQPDGRTWTLDEPKTRRSRRTVPLPDAVVRALRTLRARQAAEKLAAGGAYRDLGFVFARADGSPLREDALLPVLHRACARLGLPEVSLYSLRHAAASLRLHAGVPLKVVSDLLGHSSITLTADTYSHVTDELQQEAVDRFVTYMTTPAREQRA